MPTLEFPGHGLDSQYLHAVMVYPNDNIAQGRLLAASAGYHISENITEGTTLSIPADLLKKIVSSESYEVEVEKSAIKSSHGLIAGEILVYLARMQLAGIEAHSRRKAMFLAGRYYATAINVKGKITASSTPILKQYLEEFRTVAHLWAAFSICSIPNTTNYMEEFNIHEPEMMAKFLSVAEWFRNFDETYEPRRQHKTVDQQETSALSSKMYTLGDRYTTHSPTITWGSMENWMIEELKGYKSR